MTHRPGNRPRITREELDRLFDREMDGPARRDLVGRLGRDPDAADEVSDIRGIVHSMRLRPDETPDMTETILARLESDRGFVPARARRRIKAGRLAAAACLTLGVLGVAIAQRVAPESFRLRGEPTPVADLTDAVKRDSQESTQKLAEAVRELASVHAGERFTTGGGGLADGSQPARSGPADDGTDTADAAGRSRSITIMGIGADDNPGLATPIARRYLTLTISADAEVLAFDAASSAFVLPESLAGTGAPVGEMFGARYAFVPRGGGFAADPASADAGVPNRFGSTAFGPNAFALSFSPWGGASADGFAFGTATIHARSYARSFANPLNGSLARIDGGEAGADAELSSDLRIEKGTVPMSFFGESRSAYVGTRDPLGDAIRKELREERRNGLEPIDRDPQDAESPRDPR